jgi:Tfp pilus assembly protein PilW
MIQRWTKKRLTVANQRGLMLVELMVAMSIFLLVLVGIFQVFDPSRGAYHVSEHKLARPRH